MGGPMRRARRQRAARRQEAWALRWSRAGQHAWAIDVATEAVALRRPLAEQHPAAMARALAVRAACLYIRGRTTEAARDVEECLAYWGRANRTADMADLAAVASLLDQAGRAEEALALAEQLFADARALQDQPSTPMLVYGELLLRHGRAEEAVAVLREGYAATAGFSNQRIRASAMLFEALAAAGHHQALEEHAHSDLRPFAVNAWGNIRGRLLYIHLLELLQRHGVVPGRLQPFAATIARQQRKLLRQLRRRWVLTAAIALLTGRSHEIPDWPRATVPADTGRAAALARAAKAQADIERHRESDDARALSEAWGALALARWQAGGQRSAALEAQRTALAQTRRWAAEDPDAARSALVLHLRRLADFAGTIGLRTDAQHAREEAEKLDPSHR